MSRLRKPTKLDMMLRKKPLKQSKPLAEFLVPTEPTEQGLQKQASLSAYNEFLSWSRQEKIAFLQDDSSVNKQLKYDIYQLAKSEYQHQHRYLSDLQFFDRIKYNHEAKLFAYNYDYERLKKDTNKKIEQAQNDVNQSAKDLYIIETYIPKDENYIDMVMNGRQVSSLHNYEEIKRQDTLTHDIVNTNNKMRLHSNPSLISQKTLPTDASSNVDTLVNSISQFKSSAQTAMVQSADKVQVTANSYLIPCVCRVAGCPGVLKI